MKLIALKKLGRTVPGDIFEIRDQEARALIAMKIAKPFEADPPLIEAIHEHASPDVVNALNAAAPRQKRRYQRRDLTAAD